LVEGGTWKAILRFTKHFAPLSPPPDVRRVGGGSTPVGRGGVEFYVEHAEDPQLGDLVVVKQRKSRLRLDSMEWGTLGKLTNIPLRSKGCKASVDGQPAEGRGRKDSKENKENSRDKPQVRFKNKRRLNYDSVIMSWRDSGRIRERPLEGVHRALYRRSIRTASTPTTPIITASPKPLMSQVIENPRWRVRFNNLMQFLGTTEMVTWSQRRVGSRGQEVWYATVV
ncbi:hypothetical protein OBBRIDRAFT_808942, partial [Obba rivulosa]